jgi:hypothetical protein
MTPCQVQERAAVETARRAVADDPETIAAETVPPRTSPTGRFALEILTDRGAGGCPPALAARLADRGLTIRRVHKGHACWRVLATA